MITISGTLIAITRLLIFYRVPLLTSSVPVKITVPTVILVLSWTLSSITVLYPLTNNNGAEPVVLTNANATATTLYHYPTNNAPLTDNGSIVIKITPYNSVRCSLLAPYLDETGRSYYDNLSLLIAPQVFLASVISSMCYCFILCRVRRKRSKVMNRSPLTGATQSPYQLTFNRSSYLEVGNGTEFLTLSLNEFRNKKRKKYIATQTERPEQENAAPTSKAKALKLIGATANSTGSSNGNNGNRRRYEYKPEMTSFIIILISTISYAPISAWCLIMSHNNEPMRGQHLPYLAFFWLLVCMGSALHPYIYTLKCEAFRKEIRRYINNSRFAGSFPFEGNVILTGRNGAATAAAAAGPSQGGGPASDSRADV